MRDCISMGCVAIFLAGMHNLAVLLLSLAGGIEHVSVEVSHILLSVCVQRSTYITELGLLESMLAIIRSLPGVDCRHEVLHQAIQTRFLRPHPSTSTAKHIEMGATLIYCRRIQMKTYLNQNGYCSHRSVHCPGRKSSNARVRARQTVLE